MSHQVLIIYRYCIPATPCLRARSCACTCTCVSKMERGDEAAISGERIELELETSPANDDQSLPCAEDGSYDQEEGMTADHFYGLPAKIKNLCGFFSPL